MFEDSEFLGHVVVGFSGKRLVHSKRQKGGLVIPLPLYDGDCAFECLSLSNVFGLL